jgi:hypothetical protein
MTDRHDCASGFSQSFNLGAEFSRKLVFRKESSRDPAQHSVGSLRLDRSRFACSVKTQTVAPGRNASLSKIARAGPQGFLSNIDHSLGPRHRKCVSLCRCPSLSMDNPGWESANRKSATAGFQRRARRTRYQCDQVRRALAAQHRLLTIIGRLWKTDDANSNFIWQERVGPPVVPPTRKGLCSILLGVPSDHDSQKSAKAVLRSR